MQTPVRWVLAGVAILAVLSPARGDDWQKTVSRVDELLAESWSDAGVKPANRADDAVFLRRAYLDLTGVIPTVGEVRAFLADQSLEKRARLVEKLLGQPGKPETGKPNHAAHLAGIWRQVMLPGINSNLRLRGQSFTFENWLRGKFADNEPYDKIVKELLTTSGRLGQSGPVVYYAALELKPEELAASTARIFLGVQIQCAQCHKHPFDHWTQNDFWSYAAHFAQLQRGRGTNRFVSQVADVATGEVKLPDTETVVKPRFLGAKSETTSSGTRREQLAKWMTARNNPYFARATVNRVWSLLFGRGIVDPVDDLGKHNPPSHPELLDYLAKDFAASGYDLRRLFRILVSTRAYQLSSEGDTDSRYDRVFARMAVKSLTAEQIYDCLTQAACKREAPTRYYRAGFASRAYDATRTAFIARFEAPTQKPTELQAGIPQALTMMNGGVLAEATDPNRSDILAAVGDAPFFTTAERVETLFLATLSRQPRPDERDRFVKYVQRGGAAGDEKKALSDVLWSLLNSTEFIVNH